MSDLAVNVAWQELLREAAIQNPHTRAIIAPQKWHMQIAESLAKIMLKSERNILENPDLLIIGSLEKAPNIEACRNLIRDIALKPVNADCRLAVILSADKLLTHAANSLLKLAEEPPSYAYLLFLMEDARFFLPTLKSRSRCNILCDFDDEREPEISAKHVPKSDSDWVEWLEQVRKFSAKSESDSGSGKSRKKAKSGSESGSESELGLGLESKPDFLVNELKSWVACAVSDGDFELAAKLENLRVIASERNLSLQMMSDLLILILKDAFVEKFDVANE